MNSPKTLTEFFDSPAKWTQGYYARDAEGEVLGPAAKGSGMINSWGRREATCWCVNGAAHLMASLNPNYPRDSFLNRLEEVVPVGSSITWNDTPGLTFEEFHRTIKQVETELGLLPQ